MPADEDADHLVNHLADECEHCGCELTEEDEETGDIRRHAVSELVARPVEVTVHRASGRRCASCGGVSRAKLPVAIRQSAFGPRLRATLAGLVGTKHLSRRETADVAGQMLGVEVSPASVQSACEEASTLLEAGYKRVLTEVKQAEYVCIDETGWRHGRHARPWLWVGVVPGRCAAFRIRDGRSATDLHSLIGEDFSGVVSCDGYTAYRRLPNAERQQCLAHLARKFNSVAVHDRGRVAGIGKELHSLIKEMMAAHRRWQFGETDFKGMSAEVLTHRLNLKRLAEEGAVLGVSPLAAHCRTMLDRLDEWFTFVCHEGVEPTNNAAERALRHSVIDRKVKLHTWSEAGRCFVERMATLRATVAELGRSSLAHPTALLRLRMMVTNHREACQTSSQPSQLYVTPPRSSILTQASSLTPPQPPRGRRE